MRSCEPNSIRTCSPPVNSRPPAFPARNATVRDSGGGTEYLPPAGGDLTHSDDRIVTSGRMRILFYSVGRYVQLGNSTINHVTYTMHSSKWQKRAISTSARVDVPATEANRTVCLTLADRPRLVPR